MIINGDSNMIFNETRPASISALPAISYGSSSDLVEAEESLEINQILREAVLMPDGFYCAGDYIYE